MSRAAGAVALGAGLALSAAAFDSPSLFVPGIAFLGLGCGAAAWVALAARGVRVERELGPARVEEEEPWPVRLKVRAAIGTPPGSELIEPLAGRALRVGGGRSRRVRIDVRFGRRGRRSLAPARLLVRDPLGLAEREISTTPGEVLVLPRIEPVLAPAAGNGDAGTERGGVTPTEAAEVEVDSLRPYRPGAPATRIHWPTVARTGAMMERRMVAERDLRPLVVLDSRRPENADALDRAVRAAASLCHFLARGGGCGLLMPGERRPIEVDPALHAWPAAHARLALVESGGRPPATPRGGGGQGAIFWVTADPAFRLEGQVPRALARAGGAERFLVCSAAGAQLRGAAFVVGGCPARRLGRGRERIAA